MSRTQIEISIGILLVLLTGTFLVVYGLNEPRRMEQFTREQEGRAIEVGAELFDNNCRPCHGPQGEGTPGLCPPLNDKHFFEGRLAEVGWSGSVEDYIVATVASGRLISTRPELYPGNGKPAMPSWSEHYGGPLRDDQIRDIATFVMNWESTAPDRASAVPAGPPVGTDITKALPSGETARGETVATAQGCVACHISTNTGPAWEPSDGEPGIGDRAATRITQPDYEGAAETPEQYLFESIVHPDVYVVPPFAPGIMPKTYGETLTDQDMADLIAYLLTIK
jgi:mono/diheme cytochrome c family protein